ncbi:MAG: hypothetical protein ABIZ69_00085, partial [Ilumatobacteraceae bacterium]
MAPGGDVGAGTATTLRAAGHVTNMDLITAPGSPSDFADPASPSSFPAVMVNGLAVIAAGAALAVGGKDSSSVLVVLSCLAVTWAIAGVVVTTRHRCPAASIVGVIALSTALGTLAWSLDTHRSITGGADLVADLGQNLALTAGAALIFNLLL